MTAPAPRPLPTLKVLASIAEVSAKEWDALFGPSPAPFVRHAWLSAMEESGSATPSTGWTPTHLTLWRDGTLIAAVPAYLKAHSFGEYIYDFGWAQASERAGLPYYPKLVLGAPLSPATTQRFGVGASPDAEVVRTLLAKAAVALAQELGASGVHVLFCTGDEAETLASLGFAHRTSLQFHWQNPGYASLEDYLARFNSKRRHQLRRELQAPSTQGVEITTVRGEALRQEHAEAAHGFYIATCERFPWGRVQLTPAFFQQAFSAMPDAVELVEARREGRRIAGAFNLVHDGVLYGRYWGAHEEVPFLHFNVCLYHSIREAIALGRQRFEPGAGGEHKIPRGFAPAAVHSAHLLFEPALDAAVRDHLSHERRHNARIIDEAEELAGMKPWSA